MRLHKITLVSPKQPNSGTPSMEAALQCAPFAPVREVELHCTAMSCHYLGGYDRRDANEVAFGAWKVENTGIEMVAQDWIWHTSVTPHLS